MISEMRRSVSEKIACAGLLAIMAMVGCGESEPMNVVGGDNTFADAGQTPAPDAAPLCMGGQLECAPGICSDVANDVLNCGSCANVCALGFSCGGGECLCDQTDCGNVCTDTAIDNQNCGQCGNACGPGGPLCTAGVCECPPAFVPATIEPDMSFVLPGNFLGFPAGSFLAAGLFTDAGTGESHGLLILFDPSETVAEFPLPADDSVPSLLSAFRFSVSLPNIGSSAAFTAASGTLTISEACSTRVVAELANATFVEINSLMDPTPAEGGCQEVVPSLRVAIGTTDSCPVPQP